MTIITESLVYAAWLSYLVFIWNQTHVVLEYGHYLGLDKILKAEEFKKYEQEVVDAKYPYFLREKHNCWLTRMLGCPFCMIGFFALPSFLLNWWSWGLVAFAGSLGFMVLLFLYNYVSFQKK